MTTERDIRNQIRYAEKKGKAEGKAEGIEQVARKLKDLGVEIAMISKSTGLTEEQIKAL